VSDRVPQKQPAATRRVDTPEFVLQAARTLAGWSLRHHATTYNPHAGVQVELRLHSRGGRTIPRAAFRSTPQWEVDDYHCIIHQDEATVWLKLRHRFD
jgi:hypothetical protein